jgi:hypothetical protein
MNKPKGGGKTAQKGKQHMEIEVGMKFIGNRNGREIQVLKVDNVSVTYQDMQYMTLFTVGRKMFEHLDITQKGE